MDEYVEELLRLRAQAKASGASAQLDEVNEQLRQACIDVEDLPEGQRWRRVPGIGVRGALSRVSDNRAIRSASDEMSVWRD